MNSTILQNNETLLFIGDSITDCGRRDAAHSPLGVGYVNWFSHLQAMREPAKQIRYINRGIGGNTAEDLNSRWYDDVIVEKPDWLSVKIGINDCNRFLSNPEANEKQSVERYRDYLEQCLSLTQKELPGTQLLLISPFYLGRDNRGGDSYRGRVVEAIRDYQQVMTELARQFGARHLDAQAVFEQFLEHRLPSDVSADMVHLNELGTLILAEAVYSAFSD